ncbi:tetratricopeptide repeat protein [Aureisphaera galaxeae]|uniref:tetratricopeptide repeat protein n=1 Tax=Aureisphaera galaxeae TaxID=1538023 RepID=UPI00234FEAAC|nr:tetratricopeptide repeat protein [Aureisphaera galaxeae]MDC8002581.1 tetratricopeptide repeat protein [Aureisphaera galaxeae]
MIRGFAKYLLICIPLCSMAQDELPEQKRKLQVTTSEAERIELLKDVTEYYLQEDRNADSAFVYIEKIERIAKNDPDHILHAWVYKYKAHAHYLNSEFESIDTFSEKALDIFESQNMWREWAEVNYWLGNAHQVRYNNKEALDAYYAAKPYLDGTFKIRLHIGLGAVYAQISDLDQAMVSYNEAFSISNELKTKKFHYDIYNGLAVINNRSGDYNKALESMNKALMEARASRDALAQVVCHHNMGYLLKTLERYEEAKRQFEMGIGLFPSITTTYLKASTYMNYAEVLFELNALEETKRNLEEAEQLFNEIQATDRLGVIYNIRAKVHYKEGNPEKSIELLKEAIAMYDMEDLSYITEENHLFLSEIYEKLGDPIEALNAYKKYEYVKDSLQKRIKKEETEALKVKFDIANYQQDLQTANQELNLLEQKKKTSNYRNILLGVLSLGLIFFIYRQRKLNRAKRHALETEKELIALKEIQLNMEMEHKNTEITDFALQITERNKLLEMFHEKIRDIKKHASTEIKSQLTELQLFVGNHMELNKAKVSLNAKAEETQESFRYKLRQNPASLSPKEMQVATYLRLNLSSKQIATQMGIAEQSVNNYRRSIRKKFDLRKEINLGEFLRNI